MKPHSEGFKEQITQMGRQLRGVITYGNTTLEEEIRAITPHYEANLLKSVMKQLDLELSVDIPLETVINCQIGIMVNDNYEMLNYGNYVVYSSEKQEDTDTYKIVCYDKMLYAMKQNEDLGVTYPISIKAYLTALATKIGLTVENNSFNNQNLQIPSELYVGQEYTYRDILDEIAQATGSVICINDNDKLEVRYPNNLGAEVTATGKNITITEHEDNKISGLKIYGNSEQESTTGKSKFNIFDLIKMSNSYSNYKNGYSFKSIGTMYNIGVTLEKPIQLPVSFSYKIKNETGSNFRLVFEFDNGTSINLYQYSSGTGTNEITITANNITQSGATTITKIKGDYSEGGRFAIYDFIINEGTTAESYEPYTGGQASPNPSYPQEIHSTGDNVNEFDVETWVTKGNNSSYYSYSNGELSINALDTRTMEGFTEADRIYLPNGNYYLSNIGSASIRIYNKDTNDTVESNQFTVTLGYIYLKLVSSTVITCKPKIEQGTVATPYSPYGCGNVNEKVQNKNLFDKGNYFVSDENTRSISYDFLANDYNWVNDIQNLTLSAFVTRGNTDTRTNPRVNIEIYYTDGTTTNVNSSYITTYSKTRYQVSATRNTNKEVSRIRVRLADYGSNSGNVWNMIVEDVQLEQGTTATDYVAHEEQNISFPLAQGQKLMQGDYLADDGVHHVRGEEVLDGTENITIGTGGVSKPTNKYFDITKTTNIAKNNTTLKCTHFIQRTIWGVDQIGINYEGAANSKSVRIRANFSTIEDFKSWLAEQYANGTPVKVQYELAEEVIDPYTEEQVEALNSLSYLTLYDGVTHISSDANIEFRYVAEYETIDEEFLKDVNVDFGQKYGPINSIVLSRAAESDNVYLRNERSVQEDGLCEIKIVDNQIMNFNNRSDFLQGILDALDGLEYYINDFNSPGILYLSLLDRYSIQIGENKYKSIMLNDEVNVTTGIEEIVHTDMPEQSETDYEKADKTDRRINQTYLIVDKQNQQIESVVSNVSEQNNKISQITQTVDEINSKLQDIADITTYGESDRGYVELTDINQSEPIMIKVHPTAVNISYLYPRDNLYPSDTLYMTTRTIRFVRTYVEEGTTKTENIDYELPDDLLRYSSEIYDEFYLDYDSQTCQVIKRCGYNADGTVSQLANETTIDYPYPEILLYDGDYEIQLLGYDYGYLYVRLMAQNIYTTQFATKAEVTSSINQKANEIDISVNQKLDSYPTKTEMNSAITVSANEINSTVSRKVGKDEVISSINQSAEAVTINANKVNLAGKTINLTGDNIKIASTNFNVDKNGNVTANSLNSTNATITGGKINIKGDADAVDLLRVINANNTSVFSYLQPAGAGFVGSSGRIDITPKGSTADHSYIYVQASGSSTTIREDGITTPRVTQTSLESKKKNFEKFETGIETLNDIDIYKYNFNNEDDKTKKHIGFVIGKNYKYSKDVTSENNDGVDIYSFVSVCCQAIKEQQEQIEKMKEEIETLKGGNK